MSSTGAPVGAAVQARHVLSRQRHVPRCHVAPRGRVAAPPWAIALASPFLEGSGPGSARLARLVEGGGVRGNTRTQGRRVTESLWLDNRAEVTVDVPVEEAFKLWEDREKIPKWMPWIESVKIMQDKPELSRWNLRWSAFGQNIEVSWIAKNLQPLPNQKIHWKSEDGLPNRGAVRFFKRGPSKCSLEMTISYEVPGFLLPFAAPLGPLVENIIKGDLQRFATYATKGQAAAK